MRTRVGDVALVGKPAFRVVASIVHVCIVAYGRRRVSFSRPRLIVSERST